MSDLVRLRVRAGTRPRPEQEPPQHPTRPSRRDILVHVHADENERAASVAVVETLDRVPVLIIIGVADSAALANAEAWALRRGMDTANGVAPIRVVSLDKLGRFVAKKCGTKRAALVAFDPPWTLGRLAAHVRKARGEGMSVGLVGCGWQNRESGRWQDSDYYSRIGMVSRGGEDAGAFCRWIPSRKRTKSDRGGPFVGVNLLGDALGYDAESPRSLANSAGVVWPERDGRLDQLADEALALVDCHQRLVADLAEAAPGLRSQACWSAGSIITHGLKQAGVHQAVLTTATLSPEAIGASAASFHGGLPQALLVGVATEMALADLNWTYPTMLSLLGLTPHIGTDHFESVPVDVAEVEELFKTDGLRDRLDDRAFYRSIGNLFVFVEPHCEPDLPCQREVDAGRYRFVLAPLDLSGGTVPVHACHLIGPGLAGHLPHLVSAFRVEPIGIAPGLEPLRLPSGATVDLATGDYGRALIEERIEGGGDKGPVTPWPPDCPREVRCRLRRLGGLRQSRPAAPEARRVHENQPRRQGAAGPRLTRGRRPSLPTTSQGRRCRSRRKGRTSPGRSRSGTLRRPSRPPAPRRSPSHAMTSRSCTAARSPSWPRTRSGPGVPGGGPCAVPRRPASSS